jgi:hypothetical protein
MSHCQHVQVGWGLSHLVEFLVVVGGVGGMKPSNVFRVVKGVKTPLTKSRAFFGTARRKRDFVEMLSLQIYSMVCLYFNVWLDETST